MLCSSELKSVKGCNFLDCDFFEVDKCDPGLTSPDLSLSWFALSCSSCREHFRDDSWFPGPPANVPFFIVNSLRLASRLHSLQGCTPPFLVVLLGIVGLKSDSLGKPSWFFVTRTLSTSFLISRLWWWFRKSLYLLLDRLKIWLSFEFR